MRSSDKQNKSFFRTADRVYQANGAWFLAAREGDQGPFESEREARKEAARLVSEKKELAHFQASLEEKRRLARRAGQPSDSPIPLALVTNRKRVAERPRQSVFATREVFI